ncbi:hypothetical protein J2X61_004210 [Bacillus sp. 3255]|nr:hypothetical protein [Bacillus sp. 3255]
MMSFRKVLSALVAMCMIVTAFHVSNVSAADEFDNLRAKYVASLTGGSGYDISDPDIASYIGRTDKYMNRWNSLNKASDRTYLWSDLRYGSNTRDNDISTLYGFLWLSGMALAYKTEGSALKGNTTLRDDIISAMDWLYVNKYNENSPTYKQEGGHGFNKEIGNIQHLVKLLALMYDDLTATQLNNFLKTIDHFCPDPTIWIGLNSTAANRSAQSANIVLRGIIGKSSAKIIQGRDAMAPNYEYVTSGDGFYSDGSFIQHTDIAYTASYGAVLLRDTIDTMFLLQGSSWTITDPKVNNVYNWIFDAFEPLIYKGYIFDDLRGRAVAGPLLKNSIASILSNTLKLSQINSIYQPRLKSLVKNWLQHTNTYYSEADLSSIIWGKQLISDASVVARGDLQLYKQFHNMDVAVQQRPTYAAALSMHSTRTSNYESLNSTNLKGWHQGDGWLQLLNSDMRKFDDAYWPTMNAYRTPGTTVNQNTTYAPSKRSDKNWVGGTGISNEYGVSGMELHPNGQTLNAKKSWFMFDNEIVALGSGITSTDNKEVETIVESRMLNSSGNNTFIVNGSTQSSALGWSATLSGTNWAYLAGDSSEGSTGYYFPAGANIQAVREARTGSTRDISTETGTPDISFTRNYMTLWLNHGVNPTNQTYQYVLLPGMTSSQVQNYSSNSDISILANTTSVHAVKENSLGITAANFWEAGTVDFIRSYQPVSVMIKEEGNELTLAVSDPTQTQSKITLELGKIGASVVNKDDSVTVSRMAPYTRIEIDTSSSNGKTHNVKLRYNTKAHEYLPPVLDVAVDVAAEKLYRGEQTTVTVNVYNGGERTPGGELDLNAPEGWILDLANFEIPSLAPGESLTFTAQLTVPADAKYGQHSVTATLKSATVTHSVADQVEVAKQNIALGKPVTQSSTAYLGVPERAVDGNINGAYSGGSVTHTNENSLQPWWQVDLGTSQSIEEIYIWNRSDSCCSKRLSNYYVMVSETPFTNGSLAETLQQPGLWASHQIGEAGRPTTVAVGQSGRFVRIQLEGKNALSLAEVQVIRE